MFKLLLVEKHSLPSTLFLIYMLLPCIVSQYTVLVSLPSLTLLVLHKCMRCWLKT